MEPVNTCLCCLLRPPEKDLSTPYPRLGTTEIYSSMLEYCFQIKLTADGEEGGICEQCVDRLRGACDFRLQVESSQVGLKAWRETYQTLEEKAPKCLPERCDYELSDGAVSHKAPSCQPAAGDDEMSDGSLPHEEPPVKLETNNDDELYDEEPPVKVEADSGDVLLYEEPPVKTEADSAGEGDELRVAGTSNWTQRQVAAIQELDLT